ncbi:MAG: histidine kinase, partial [Herbinix sp.]|nr:histidine kinase [Herbinix sp.]
MKIRYLSIIFTVMIVLLTAMIYWVVDQSDYQAADLPTINKAYTQVIKKLEAGASIGSLENESHCKILLTSEDDYATRMYEALGDGDILLDYTNGNTLLGKIIFNEIAGKYDSLKKEMERMICYLGILMLVAINVVLLLIYQYYIKPFQKLKSFAADIAKGNLDHRLEITKDSYFGAFTESFDIMREELRKAREAEYRANTSKKELVASLSHDMKTPISTIKVTCEVLMMKETDQGRKEKIDIIAQKANMIDTLIDNMFHATLEELQILKVEPKEELSDIIEPMFKEL